MILKGIHLKIVHWTLYTHDNFNNKFQLDFNYVQSVRIGTDAKIL